MAKTQLIDVIIPEEFTAYQVKRRSVSRQLGSYYSLQTRQGWDFIPISAED